jgi:hypothetical protein
MLGDRKKLAAAPIAEMLKPHGFRKSGLNFSALRDEAMLIIGLQSSTESTQDVLKITCNAAIQLRQLARGSRPSAWDAHWRKRIGFFMPEPQDFWWACASDEAADRAGREIAALLETIVLREMERLAVPAAMAALWKSGSSPGLTDRQRVECLSELRAGGVTATD